MGYDMYFVRSPDGEDAAYEAARKSFDAAVEHRDSLCLPFRHADYQAAQAEVARTYDAMEAARTTHFFLTTWAMSECRGVMDHFGMLVAAQPPARPAPEAYGTTSAQAAPSTAGGAAPEQVRHYHRALRKRLAWTPPRPGGIVIHKLGGDEGWMVTPGEIRAALAAYETSRASNPALLSNLIEDADWWPEWIDYLRRAAAHGGFRTYGPSVT
ncbi:hypothetical protein ABZX77_47490 [Streptomyces sp. NPDC004237]|uniref:hypothetical protein n=1 Tax=Streptomyces sp. NPDC004237 TaxID=3154455 RepID=UPI0033B74400